MTKTSPVRTSFFLILFVSLLEGGSLMSFEILSAKIYTPFLGSSIYVWTAILTITLLGLAVGYKLGGSMSNKLLHRLHFIYIGAGIYILSSTFIARILLPLTLDLEIRFAALLSGLIILLVPVTLMGMVSPLLVKKMSVKSDLTGTSTGLIYGTGTLGGVAFALLTVYTFIPTMGVQASTFTIGSLMIIGGLICMTFKSKENE